LGAPILTIQLNNLSGVAASQVYVMLFGGSSADGQLTNQVAVTLDKLANSSFTLAGNSGAARIYFSFQKAVTVGEPFNSQTRFDWVELFYGPPAPSVINLTAVDQFGIPLSMQAFDSGNNSLGSKSWAQSGQAIIQALSKLAPNARVNTASGTFARVQSPSHVPSAYPSWNAYLSSLTGQTVTIVDVFSKAGQAPTYINYSGTFGQDATIVLSGTMTQNNAPVPGLSVVKIYGPQPPFPPPTNPPIPQLSFADQIYQANGPYFLGDTSPTYHTAGDNDAYSVVYRDVIGGLNSGFIGGKFGNNSSGWQNQPSFGPARKTDDGFYNQYAAQIHTLSNGEVYGYAFSDYGGDPQLAITNAATLKIAILPDSRSSPG
jgi:hypothetical protein